MRLAVAIGVRRNAHFANALDRIFQEQKTLQTLLREVEVDYNVGIFSIVVSDRPANYFKRVQTAETEGFYQVVVGYDMDSTYPPSDDDKIIRMFSGWLRRGFREEEGYASTRANLLRIVDEWEERSIHRIASECRSQ